LKKSCTIAAEKDLSKSTRFRMLPKETKIPVTEVPILAPIIMGIAEVKVSVPAPTKAMIMEVVDEDDWIIAVAKSPIINPIMGSLVAF